jgi:hypothetical protein
MIMSKADFRHLVDTNQIDLRPWDIAIYKGNTYKIVVNDLENIVTLEELKDVIPEWCNKKFWRRE